MKQTLQYIIGFILFFIVLGYLAPAITSLLHSLTSLVGKVLVVGIVGFLGLKIWKSFQEDKVQTDTKKTSNTEESSSKDEKVKKIHISLS